MSTWPSILTTISDPIATNRLNSPSHSSIEQAQNDAIKKIETFVGTQASAVGTLIYNIRAAGSGGGGHVQTAVLGGTGQTAYTKGDILVAVNSSTVSKLAVGADGQILKADSSVASGAKWIDDSTPKISTSVLGSVIGNGLATETSVFSVSIPGSTLGTNGAIRVVVSGNLSYDGATPFASAIARLNYGGNPLASCLLNAFDGLGLHGVVEMRVIATGATNAQWGDVRAQFQRAPNASPSVIGMATGFGFGTTSVESGGAQTLGFTWKFSNANTSNQFTPRGVIVEKIT